MKKTVRWYRMAPVEEAGAPDAEIEEVAWVPVSEAPVRLSYDSDRKLLQAHRSRDSS